MDAVTFLQVKRALQNAVVEHTQRGNRHTASLLDAALAELDMLAGRLNVCELRAEELTRAMDEVGDLLKLLTQQLEDG